MLVAFDTETYLISEETVAPKMVCLSVAFRNDDGTTEARLYGNGDPELVPMLEWLFTEPSLRLVGHNTAYDTTVIINSYPDLTEAIWAAYGEERISCTQCNEKLLDLGSHGQLEKRELPDGTMEHRGYSLADLETQYIGVDRTEQKKAADAWRLNYSMLDGKKASEYAPEAYQYACDDALNTLQVAEHQEARATDSGQGSMATREFLAAADFALRHDTCYGMMTDPEKIQEVAEWMAVEQSPEKHALLVSSGVLRPGEEPRPYKNKGGSKSPVQWDFSQHPPQVRRPLLKALCVDYQLPEPTTDSGNFQTSVAAATNLFLEAKGKVTAGADATDAFLALEELAQEAAPGEERMTKGKEPSINEKILKELVAALVEKAGLPPKTTKTGEVSIKESVLLSIKHLSPVIQQFLERQKTRKILTTELPRMQSKKGVVRFNFNVLVRTTRTSSFASGLYPSANGQNIDPRVRPCYVAREGKLLCSVDYSSAELVTAAQKQIQLFGQSHLGDLIKAGIGPHEYLGAQLAFHLDDGFRTSCQEEGVTEKDGIYKVFYRCKTDEREEVREFYKHYRTFAKPTGLGYPGGLGPATFVEYAAGTYDVAVSIEMAHQLKEIWLDTFPEFKQYFDWVNNACKAGPPVVIEGEEKPKQRYAYTTPLGAYRANCSYTSCCNGAALQSPTAEGAKLGVWHVRRACYDPAQNSMLFGCRPVNFIHDENLVEIPDDQYAHERAFEIARLMVDGMKAVVTDLPVLAEPALMHRWYKKAEPVFDANGRLIPWTPES